MVSGSSFLMSGQFTKSQIIPLRICIPQTTLCREKKVKLETNDHQ